MPFLHASEGSTNYDIGKSPTWDGGRPHEVGKVTPDRAATVRRLNKRRQVLLQDIDNAKFSWFHVKVAFVSGAGFFTDAYDIFAINIVSVMLGLLYGSDGNASLDSTLTSLPGRSLSTGQEIGIKIATPVGVLLGQLLFGWLGDMLGRKRIYGMELAVIMVATFGQALCAPATAINVIGVLIFWRFVMGIGIGGDYPISAVISSEFSSVYIRGRVMAAVFANQGWGQLSATLFSFIIISAYKHSFLHDPPLSVLRSIDQIWRLIIGLGCVPAAVAIYFRLTIPETPRFTMDIERDIKQASSDVHALLSLDETYTVDPDALTLRVRARQANSHDFLSYFSKWENLKVLIGTSYSWLALDIAFYGLGLNSSIILDAIGFGTPSKDGAAPAAVVYQTLRNLSLGNLILSLAGLVPGYWAAFVFIDRWGRKPIQFMGFSVLTVLFLIMGLAYNKMIASSGGKAAFVVLYCIANFFQNFGPNTTSFIIPGEAFPTRYRATAHGISAASGKFGAVIAQLAFQWLKDAGGPNKFNHILEIFAFFMLTGVLSTMLIPETSQKSLEVISNESQDDFIQAVPLSDNGSSYLNRFQTSPIMLSPIEPHIVTSLPSRPPTAFSDRTLDTHKGRKASLTRLASISDVSVTS
ncbi:phosphate transporter [Lentinus tigrinus ALCF2SS1-7]|uniref:Phosphate transporter n=1 Tax=Lentinus tigrinus ALCF2SS1-6 TaxID=1328759 RepID=A0A5C2SD03_9APHY|nr:phosphate transporter [Lentinus tigrinus ALCF2SS1-6]RPD75119.1 phosphate transporter [Lentinus tigrinus ALCF2SS1-7]